MKRKALVVLSGGQDSTTCLFWAIQACNAVCTLSFDYGQRHTIELGAARKVSDMARVSHHIVDIQGALLSTSPLLDPRALLEKYDNFEQMDKTIGDRVELTFVPMRNMLFATIAMNRAVAWGCDLVVLGICQADNANYPDCTQEFLEAFNKAQTTALGNTNIEVHAPLLFMSKAESTRMAMLLPGCWEALAYTHTSYDGKYPPTDMNHANVLRARGFEEANLPDPLVERAWREGLMELPSTDNYISLRADKRSGGMLKP